MFTGNLIVSAAALRFGIVGCCCLLLAGCGTATPETFPVTGKVLVNRKPAEGATVFLHPLGERSGRPILPTAKVEADGTFAISTFKHRDGAPAGEYALTLIWPSVTTAGGETVEGSDRLKDEYRNPNRPAAKVTVAAGPNQIPAIELSVH